MPILFDDPARCPQFEACVSDRRVLVWDLYNEPGGDRPKESLPLMEAAFRWAARPPIRSSR